MSRPARPFLLTAVLITAAAASPAAAQRGGTVEVTPLARYGFYPDSLQLKSGLGVGGELGLFVTRKLSVELEGSYAVTSLPDSTSVSVSGVAGRLLVHLPLRGRSTALFGIGYTKHTYGRGLDVSQEGPGGLIGLRLGFGPRVGLRLEAAADHLATVGGGSGRLWDIGAQAGISIFAGPLGPRDSDRDGVPNAEDRCPGTAAGQPVDPTGCAMPHDSDSDGVLDGVDRCPGTAAGQRVDLTGCNADLDGDGVPNALDRCPGTPPDSPVDQFGCPPPQPPADSDADGVPDARDRCPGSAPGSAVDGLGCAVPRAAPEPARRLILRGVTFASGSARLTPAAEESLRATAAGLLAAPAVRLEVAGYTDDTGPRAANERISLARAKSVRAFLASAGVSDSLLTARGYGPADPVASNATSAGRAENRRVELRPIGGNAP
jgi:OmpA-OmpF porin, OOP family